MDKHSFVMMLDDDQSILNILTRVLEMDGRAQLPNVKNVLNTLGQSRPNMVVIDIETPDIENSEVLRSLTDGTGTPAIMLTARCEVTTLKEALCACTNRSNGKVPPGETVGSMISKFRNAVPGTITTN